MNLLDFLIIFSLIISIIYSLIRGFVKEIFSLLSIILGVIIAIRAYEPIADKLNKFIHDSTISKILGFIICLIIVSIIVRLVGIAIKKIITTANIGWIDRFSGAIFGLLKGIIIWALILILFITFLPPEIPLLKASKLAPLIIPISLNLACFATKTVKDKFYKNLATYNSFWENLYRNNLPELKRTDQKDTNERDG